MTKRKTPQIQPRKAPRQARSATLVAAILQAAVRVLERDGAQRFTTVRVAERAGVSVGSLYQYFPNKQSLLFRLQADEWQQTWSMVSAILEDRTRDPPARLRRAVLAFFRSEHAEASLRVALADASAQLRDAPESAQLRERATRGVQRFSREALPGRTPATRRFVGDFIITTLSAVAERVTSEPRSAKEVERWAQTCADLLCGYLVSQGQKTPR